MFGRAMHCGCADAFCGVFVICFLFWLCLGWGGQPVGILTKDITPKRTPLTYAHTHGHPPQRYHGTLSKQ